MHKRVNSALKFGGNLSPYSQPANDWKTMDFKTHVEIITTLNGNVKFIIHFLIINLVTFSFLLSLLTLIFILLSHDIRL